MGLQAEESTAAITEQAEHMESLMMQGPHPHGGQEKVEKVETVPLAEEKGMAAVPPPLCKPSANTAEKLSIIITAAVAATKAGRTATKAVVMPGRMLQLHPLGRQYPPRPTVAATTLRPNKTGAPGRR